jgi:hypothetical protein
METRIGDIKLIHHKNNPVVYARVEEITADVKPGWWQVRLLILQVPARRVSWILRDEYIDGAEFTMDGEPMVLEALAPAKPELQAETPHDIDLAGDLSPEAEAQSLDPAPQASDDNGGDDGGGSSKVVDLSSRRRKR